MIEKQKQISYVYTYIYSSLFFPLSLENEEKRISYFGRSLLLLLFLKDEFSSFSLASFSSLSLSSFSKSETV
jgi:hypothetical protein